MFEDLINTCQKRYQLTKDCFLEPMKFGTTNIYQIGRLFCDGETRVPRHCQLNYIELTVVTGGEGVAIINGKETKISIGDIHLAFPGDFHEIISNKSSPLEYDYIAFSTEDTEFSVEIERIILEFHDEAKRIIRDDNIRELLSRSIAEITERSDYSERMTAALLDEMLIRIIRAYKSVGTEKQTKGVSDAQILCYSMMNYIDTHIYTMKSLRELASALRYNYNYLSNLYRDTTQDTLLNYYRNRRLETARILLTKHPLSVTEVSNMLNYSSLYTFSRAYKNRYGTSPSGKIR